EAARSTLDALTAALGNHTSVIALLVEQHGVRLVAILFSLRHPAIATWCGDLAFSFAVAEGNDVTGRAAALLSGGMTPRAALARLIRESGVGIIGRLCENDDDSNVRALLELPPRRARGRQAGSTTTDTVSYVVSVLVDDLHIKPAKLLKALGKETRSHSGAYRRLPSRRRRAPHPPAPPPP